MAGSASFTISGDRDVSRKIRAYGTRAEDVSKAWPRVGSYLSRAVRQQFVTEGVRFGKPWKPVKPAYRLWKIRNGLSRKTLVATGAMRQSFVGRPMDIEEYRGNTAVFGSSDPKAVWHHYGTRRDGKRVNPARPILVITNDVAKDVRQILADHITGRN